MNARFQNQTTKNLKMDDRVYKLRREVIDYIYEAKEVVELPRITVRITDNDVDMLACAKMKKNILWVTQRAIVSDWDLRVIVYHEIAHAVFGTEHVAGCKLMKPTQVATKLSKAEAQKLLVKYSAKAKKETI